jgi:hypothetical protein
MYHKVGGILVLLFGLPVAATGAARADKPATPAQQYQALLKEYEVASRDFRNANTDEERKKAVERLDTFPPRFLELAEKYPRDAIVLEVLTQAVRVMNAVDSLTLTAWEMNHTAFPAGSKDQSAGRAVTLLLRDHGRSDKIGLVCERMRYGIRKEYETFLVLVLRNNPHREVQGVACLALAQFLNSRLQKLNLLRDRPELARRYEDLFGKDDFKRMQRRGRAKLAREVEEFFEDAADSYGNVKLPYGGTVGETAQSELFEIRHLAVGKEAPDIESTDQDGKRFKLSDYRGKVVLLDFWSEY